MARHNVGKLAAWAMAALAALGAAQAGGCFQASGLGDITFAPPDGGAGAGGSGGAGVGGAMPDGGPACTGAAQCDDQNPCTTDACTAGHCEHTSKPDGTACDLGGAPGSLPEGRVQGRVQDVERLPDHGPLPGGELQRRHRRVRVHRRAGRHADAGRRRR